MELLETTLNHHLDEIVHEIDYAVTQYQSEFADTYRCTPIQGKCATEEERAKHYRKRSCCGQSDWEYKTKDGHYYLVGYNYGH